MCISWTNKELITDVSEACHCKNFWISHEDFSRAIHDSRNKDFHCRDYIHILELSYRLLFNGPTFYDAASNVSSIALNRKLYHRMKSWPNSRYVPSICLYKMNKKTTKNPRIWVFNLTRPEWIGWIGLVMLIERTVKKKISQVFNNNLRGNRLRRRPKNRWWNCVRTVINAKL